MPQWTFKDLPAYMDANMPRDRVVFINENGIYEMTGVDPALPGSDQTVVSVGEVKAPPTEAEMEAELEKASKAAMANFERSRAGAASRTVLQDDSLQALNQMSQQLAQRATENIVNGVETVWAPFNYIPSQNYPKDGWLQSLGGRQDLQNSVQNTFDGPQTLGWIPTQRPVPPPQPPRAASSEPEPLSKNGGRFIMLEDPK